MKSYNSEEFIKEFLPELFRDCNIDCIEDGEVALFLLNKVHDSGPTWDTISKWIGYSRSSIFKWRKSGGKQTAQVTSKVIEVMNRTGCSKRTPEEKVEEADVNPCDPSKEALLQPLPGFGPCGSQDDIANADDSEFMSAESQSEADEDDGDGEDSESPHPQSKHIIKLKYKKKKFHSGVYVINEDSISEGGASYSRGSSLDNDSPRSGTYEWLQHQIGSQSSEDEYTTINLWVKTLNGGWKHLMEVDLNTTIQNLSELVQDVTGVPLDKVRLSFGKTQLSDLGRSLLEYGIEDESVIYQLGRLRGGTKDGSHPIDGSPSGSKGQSDGASSSAQITDGISNSDRIVTGSPSSSQVQKEGASDSFVTESSKTLTDSTDSNSAEVHYAGQSKRTRTQSEHGGAQDLRSELLSKLQELEKDNSRLSQERERQEREIRRLKRENYTNNVQGGAVDKLKETINIKAQELKMATNKIEAMNEVMIDIKEELNEAENQLDHVVKKASRYADELDEAKLALEKSQAKASVSEAEVDSLTRQLENLKVEIVRVKNEGGDPQEEKKSFLEAFERCRQDWRQELLAAHDDALKAYTEGANRARELELEIAVLSKQRDNAIEENRVMGLQLDQVNLQMDNENLRTVSLEANLSSAEEKIQVLSVQVESMLEEQALRNSVDDQIGSEAAPQGGQSQPSDPTVMLAKTLAGMQKRQEDFQLRMLDEQSRSTTLIMSNIKSKEAEKADDQSDVRKTQTFKGANYREFKKLPDPGEPAPTGQRFLNLLDFEDEAKEKVKAMFPNQELGKLYWEAATNNAQREYERYLKLEGEGRAIWKFQNYYLEEEEFVGVETMISPVLAASVPARIVTKVTLGKDLHPTLQCVAGILFQIRVDIFENEHTERTRLKEEIQTPKMPSSANDTRDCLRVWQKLMLNCLKYCNMELDYGAMCQRVTLMCKKADHACPDFAFSRKMWTMNKKIGAVNEISKETFEEYITYVRGMLLTTKFDTSEEEIAAKKLVPQGPKAPPGAKPPQLDKKDGEVEVLINPDKQTCKFFDRGHCKFGRNCEAKHAALKGAQCYWCGASGEAFHTTDKCRLAKKAKAKAKGKGKGDGNSGPSAKSIEELEKKFESKLDKLRGSFGEDVSKAVKDALKPEESSENE